MKRPGSKTVVTAICLLGSSVLSGTLAADPSTLDNWQERRLMAPTPAERDRERHGQVFIYDGLEYAKVQRALDLNFDRMENMMFTRIRQPAPTANGGYVQEDDGCD